MNDTDLHQLLQHDFSKGTEQFSEQLLQDCLDQLNSDSNLKGIEIDDEELEMLAAAGNTYIPQGAISLDDEFRKDIP